jgi:hypothetical protein
MTGLFFVHSNLTHFETFPGTLLLQNVMLRYIFKQMAIITSFICTLSISEINVPPLAAAQKKDISIIQSISQEKYAALATFLKRNKQHEQYFR